VLEPPPDVAETDVLAEVRRVWEPDIDRVAYQQVGFGAHHWAAYARADARLFVTYDVPLAAAGTGALSDLEAAYTGAVALGESGLEFVLAPLTTPTGRVTVPFSGGALSCTPWRQGVSDEPLDVAWTAEFLGRLHRTPPPKGIPAWRPKVGEDFAESTALLLERDAWGPGPHADTARDAVRRHLGAIERWTLRYHHLGAVARDRPWVASHGEPHEANQLRTSEGRLLVDWDTLRLAPAELDLRILVDAGVDPQDAGADPEMVELFDLQWRLDEISQYSQWFAAPHTGTPDDDIAIGGLLEELTRP
jgi:spectinomycin phosphotransferase